MVGHLSTEAVLHGAGMRVRPVMMTAAATIAGLLPILFGTGTGSEVVSRIAAPMVGGMVSSVLLTLLVVAEFGGPGSIFETTSANYQTRRANPTL